MFINIPVIDRGKTAEIYNGLWPGSPKLDKVKSENGQYYFLSVFFLQSVFN